MDISLHPKQLEVFLSPKRNKIIAAGRRFGKTYFSVVHLLREAAKTEKIRSDGTYIDLSLEEIYYVHPTFDQGKKIVWPLLIQLAEQAGMIEKPREQIGELVLTNGRKISIKGSDRPDNLRGTGLSAVVLDEYAFMKPTVWDMIIEPQLLRSEGSAVFIGTPDGKNHFYDLYIKAQRGELGGDWGTWHFKSIDNPFLPRKEIEKARRTKSSEVFKQEYEASFDASGGTELRVENFPIVDNEWLIENRVSGTRYIAVDLAGFEKAPAGHTMHRRDEHSISVVLAHRGGWLIENVIHGHWDTREAAIRIVKAYRDYRPALLGIEKGMAKYAVEPYLKDQQERVRTYFNVEPLTHHNQKKSDRIAWALQGRSEKGRIQLLSDRELPPGQRWNSRFLQQVNDFPNQLAHDDLIDSTAFIDQLAPPWVDMDALENDYWEPMDNLSGY